MIDSRDKTEKINSPRADFNQARKSTDIPSNRGDLAVTINSLENQGFGIELPASELSQIIQTAGRFTTQKSCFQVLSRLGTDHPDIKFPVDFDPSWMGKINCRSYAFYLMRRENIASFPELHGSRDPVQALARSGYLPTKEEKDWSIVMYTKDSEPTHWGILRRPPDSERVQVVSKDSSGNVIIHPLNLSTWGNCAFIFEKPMNLGVPIPNLGGINDWTLQDGLFATRIEANRFHKLLRNLLYRT